MQQKAQLITTLLHEPRLVIVDEPFSGLDPVNTKMVKDILRDLRDLGAAIIMSTHQMHQVEELCDRILLIDRGHALLAGEISQVRSEYAGNAVFVRIAGSLPALKSVEQVERHNAAYRLNLTHDTTPDEVLKQLLEAQCQVEWFEIAIPTLEEIFIQVVEGSGTRV
jgi:ABC-2 type transport system ATP-binding protein